VSIKNGQTGNVGHTRHKTKSNKIRHNKIVHSPTQAQTTKTRHEPPTNNRRQRRTEHLFMRKSQRISQQGTSEHKDT